MRVRIERKYVKPEYIIGLLYVDGEFKCNTLEQPYRNNERGTAIPWGVYEVILNNSAKFGRTLPLFLDVPNRDGIRIHRGNTVKDSSGCILVGENREKGKVLNSTHWEEEIVRLMKEAKSRKEMICVEIV